MSIFHRFWGNPPAKAPEAAAVSKPAERRQRKRSNAKRGLHALIIDDSPTILAALSKILRSAGYVTAEAASAEEGLQLAKQSKPSLIFLDILLPGMNGFAALRAVRRDPVLRDVPVIMISGNEQAAEQFYFNRIGADDFMKKPFSRFEVFSRIESLLDGDSIPRRKGTAVATPPPAAPRPSLKAAVPEKTAGGVTSLPVGNVPVSPAAADLVATMSTLDARKELAAIGLKYYDQEAFNAAIERGDQLAIRLFVRGGGVSLPLSEAPRTNKTQA